jgi:hypothetical protein
MGQYISAGIETGVGSDHLIAAMFKTNKTAAIIAIY